MQRGKGKAEEVLGHGERGSHGKEWKSKTHTVFPVSPDSSFFLCPSAPSRLCVRSLERYDKLTMTKPTDVRVLSIASTTELIKYRSPIKFGGRVVIDAMLLNVTLEVETRDGKRGQGFGSMPMGNVWAWPTDAISTEQTSGSPLASSTGSTARFRGFNSV